MLDDIDNIELRLRQECTLCMSCVALLCVLGLGVLVGWHRVPRPSADDPPSRATLSGTLRSMYSSRVAAPKHTLFVNPVDQDMPLTWYRHDQLLVVRRQ